MEIDYKLILENSIYFLALINPFSKVLFLASYTPELDFKSLWNMSWKATLWALGILVVFTLVGQFILHEIFRVEIYSLKVVGGMIIFAIGWNAVRKGMFFQKEDYKVHESLNEMSIVPLATPLIAGPGTITVVISSGAQYGIFVCLASLYIALTLNLGFMLFSLVLSRFTQMLSLTGPLIRITGLIVAVVAMQMVFSGLGEWIRIAFH
jgi:multiple antibiotic resistance protein